MTVAQELQLLAQRIDHTNLRADATHKDLRRLCEEAARYRFRTICVHPDVIADARKVFHELGVIIPICTVIGFPLGRMTTDIKVMEAHFSSGINRASEVDMVMNIARFKDGDYSYVEREIKRVHSAVAGTTLKVIIETCYLTDEEIKTASKIAQNSGAHFVKTSTGFGPRGATIRDVELIFEAVGETVEIKASGGIKTFADVRALMDAGADRLGLSSSVAVMEEARTFYEKTP